MGRKDYKTGLCNSATTLAGAVNPEWFGPLLEHWSNMRPQLTWGAVPLYRKCSNKWDILKGKRATAGAAKAALTRLQKELGCGPWLKLRSARAWIPTCARQLLYSREERGKLGQWGPGSLIPDRYGRAICATELRIWGEIPEKSATGVETR